MDLDLRENERLDYLLGESLRIIQSPNVFSFSLDAVLLSWFTYLPVRKGLVVDLCSGNGVIPLFLSRRTCAKVIGVEIQERLYDMAIRSVAYNQLSEQIEMVHCDLKQVAPIIGFEKYDVVTCNPPYFLDIEASNKNQNPYFTIARHEVMCTLADCVQTGSQLLKQGGKFSIVHRPDRLIEMFTLMKANRLEPKRVQFIYPKQGREANMVLIEAAKDGKPGVKVLHPVVVYEENDTYTAEVSRMINGK